MIDMSFVSHKRSLLFASLLVVVLVSSCFISVSISNRDISLFTSGAADIAVSNETELRNAIDNAQTGKTTIVALDKDITLTNNPLAITANKDIRLTSNKVSGYYKLIGADGKSTITVEGNGILQLDGIIVTHENGAKGLGVHVRENGQCIMNNGEISGNTYPYDYYAYAIRGGGVCNTGIFELHSGKISNNKSYSDGGGVFNSINCTFKMFGGEISNNQALCGSGDKTSPFLGYGGGVSNHGVFELHGGKISNNIADGDGGGVYMQTSYGEAMWGVFRMFGGTISGNTAGGDGGGIYSAQGGLLQGGTISGNKAGNKGGGVYWLNGYLGGWGVTVFGNTANNGNDVYTLNTGGDESSNGNGGSTDGNGGDGLGNGNNGLPDGGNNGSSNGNKGLFVWRFDAVVVLVIYVITVIVMGVVLVVLFVYFQKRIKQVEKKQK